MLHQYAIIINRANRINHYRSIIMVIVYYHANCKDGIAAAAVAANYFHYDGIDVSRIAKEFGGGGHIHAAGFKI